MAAFQQQGAGVRLEMGDIDPDPGLPDPEAQAETGVYISPPLVGEAADYPGGVTAFSGKAEPGGAASDEPFNDEISTSADTEQPLEESGGWTSSVVEVGRKIDTRLRHELQEHPYRSLAAAAAVGYMLHSGVTSRSGRLVLMLGGRYALQAFANSMSGEEE